MAGLLLVLCVASLGAAVGIVYLLYGPTAAKPLVSVPRASLTIIPPPRAAQSSAYDPEAVFASERAAAMISPVPVAPSTFAAMCVARPTPAPFTALVPAHQPAPMTPAYPSMPQVAAPMPPAAYGAPMPPAAYGAPMPPAQVAQVAHLAAPSMPPAPPSAGSGAHARSLPPPTPAFMRGRVTAPQPLPRARAARGTDSPRTMQPARVAADAAFADSAELRDFDADPTVLADDMAS